ncbi:hypothetical protein [Clostridium oceanicum]|uniref:Lipoprotein n=1 Tax=Clostridium oceanicum TaxID=1543 RepID=A0ABP3V9H2_9CLOT
MSQTLLCSMISACAIIIGAIIGGLWTSYTSKKSNIKNEEIQRKVLEENKKIEDGYDNLKIKESASIIRLDICTCIFQSIRTIKYINRDYNVYYPTCIPINKHYWKDISRLYNTFDLKEISLINQIYGIIEKINYDVRKLDYNKKNFSHILINYKILLKKIYKDGLYKILEVNIDECSYIDLIDNDIINEEYRNVLIKLENIIKN